MDDKNKSLNGALAVGTVLRSPNNEYVVESVLGMGGFGVTYKVSVEKMLQEGNVSQRVKLYFAIKEFFMHGCDRSGDGARVTYASTIEGEVKQSKQDFITEAKRLNQLGTRSKNIVKVNEVFEANDTAYYVMEYLDSGSIYDYVKSHGSMSWNEAKNIIVPIAQAVGLLHNEKLLHMDIKPDNIMLKRDRNGDMIPTLIDFGIAKHFDSKGKPTSHLMAKGASDGYAPMEQYAGIDNFAPEIDVYALGATLLFLLTAKQPPKAFDLNANIVAEQLPTSLSSAQKEVITKAMNPNKFERTATVKDFVQALNEFSPKQVEKVEATPKEEKVEKEVASKNHHSETKRMGQSTSTKPAAWKYAAIVAVVVALIVGAFFIISSQQEKKPQPAEGVSPVKEADGTLTYTVNGVTFKMKYVEGGTFMMGANEDDGINDIATEQEKPRHSVTLSNYYIGETEVTQALWKAIMGSNPSYFIDDNMPVEHVTWSDCQKFIGKLNAITNATFSLPTEAQWEYAARGGNKSQGYLYSGSNKIDDVAWYEDNSGETSHAVGTKQANELGLYDMSGNAWEWCSDWYGNYNASSQNDPTGSSTGQYRVNRGGSWAAPARFTRVSYRFNLSDPNSNDVAFGLRLALRKLHE